MSEPSHHFVAREVERLASQLHDLAFDVGEVGVTPHVQAKADAIGDALLAAVHRSTPTPIESFTAGKGGHRVCPPRALRPNFRGEGFSLRLAFGFSL